MAHQLSVEGDKVIERDEHGHVVSTKDYAHVHRGYLATSHNLSVSEEARQNAEEILHDLELAHGDKPSASPGQSKAKAHPPSPKTPKGHDAPPHATRAHDHDEELDEAARKEEIHRHRQIGTYRGILKKNVSPEAKQHARDMLAKLGAPVDDE
ncbi:hypothetical protein JCM10212_000166 [Sporobolomyces blumeae]